MLPPNLQEHLLRVTSVAHVIANHWKDGSLDKETLIKATLLHDLGNIIKFHFDRPELLGTEAKNLDHWKMVQKQMIAMYGPDEHHATAEMCKELGVDEKTLFIISHIGFSNYESIVISDNYELKVCTYADHRTSPAGILSLKDRFDEVLQRRKAHENTQVLISLAYDVEKQIQERVTIDLSKIKSEDIEKLKEQFIKFEIV